MFIQHVTSHVFTELSQTHFPTPSPTGAPQQEETLTGDEKKILRYAAGYIPRKLMEKLDAGSAKRPRRSVLRLCVTELVEEAGSAEEGDDLSSTDWLKMIDRGGLLHVTSKMYQFMCSVELVIKGYLKREGEVKRAEMNRLIGESEDVGRRWEELSGEWDPSDSKVIFGMIRDVYVEMREFSFVSAWMEKWKCEAKKSVQKAQAFRKKISKH